MTKTPIRIARTLTAIAVLVLLVSATVANAQQFCVPRDAAVAQLQGKFKEQVVGRGLVEAGKAMVELFVSESGSWTVVRTGTDGRSCIVAGGAAWTRAPLLVGDPA